MQKKEFTVEYKREIIRLITEEGKKVSDIVVKDIGATETSIRRWLQQYGEHGENAFPGKGHLRPADEELRKLKRELANLKGENEILKSYAHLHKAREIRYKFIMDNSSEFRVGKMCPILELRGVILRPS
jgi:transposase